MAKRKTTKRSNKQSLSFKKKLQLTRRFFYPALGMVVAIVLGGAMIYTYQQNNSGAGCKFNPFSRKDECTPKPKPKPRVVKKNPYTAECPGNKVSYGVPKGSTATASARKKVFGQPYPNANTTQITFMDSSPFYINTKIVPCLKAVEWDLKYKHKTNYKLNEIHGASEVNSQNPEHFFHAYGGAVDINPATNPYYADCKRTCPHDMPASWVKAFRAHGFFWGGNFKNVKDYMHFEWHGQK